MWEPSNIAEKKFSAENQRLIGKRKLHEFGRFIENIDRTINKNKKKILNNFDISFKLISLDEEPYESTTILHLTHSENKVLARILSTLGSLCNEIEYTIQRGEELYPPFLFYEDETAKTDDNIQLISSVIETIQKVQSIVIRANYIIGFTLKQLSSILYKEYYVSDGTCNFSETLSLLSDLLICLLKFDTLLSQQVLKDHWRHYRRSLRNILHGSSRYGFNKEELRCLEQSLGILQSSVLSGSILSNTIDKCLDVKLLTEIKKTTLNVEFRSYILYGISQLENDFESISYTDLWLQLNVITVFYINVFGVSDSKDKKLVKKVLEINKKISSCTLVGNFIWYPEKFLLKHAPFLIKFIDEKNINSVRLNNINTVTQKLPKEAITLYWKACKFLLDFEKNININFTRLAVSDLNDVIRFFLNGLKLTNKIKSTMEWTINIHVDKMLPITKTVLGVILKLAEILKCIYSVFKNHMTRLYYLLLLISQYLHHKVLVILNGIKKSQTQSKSYKQLQLDILSALTVSDNAIKGPTTKWRVLIANLALSASGLNEEDLASIRHYLFQLNQMSRYTKHLKKICNCSNLYWYFNRMLPVYFHRLFQSKTNMSRYSLIFEAISDGRSDGKIIIPEEIHKILNESFFNEINQIIETNLRLQTHLHLNISTTASSKNILPVNLIKYRPVPLNSNFKYLKIEVEHYLSEMFYNLTTVVLHDWKTYGEMRNLANLEYGIETIDDDLPLQTLDQGMDVLEIMRNIDDFVQRYVYNLNSQVFIEKSGTTKYLKSINITHVANSIRSHGIGIMNTIVNYIYQFLKKPLRIFSQLLFDEQVKSRLLKCIKYFMEHKTDLDQQYPYEQAEKFNASLKKIATTTGENYLELFRKIITQIGNALGYVRLLKSGGNRCLAESLSFVPDLSEVHQLKINCDNETFSSVCKKAVDCFNDNLNNLSNHFENTTEYYKLLIKGFSPYLCHPDNFHLKNFYMIVPPLTINFVEHASTYKEKLFKKNKFDNAFTDDGFALGVAFLTEVLNQDNDLKALHWFQSVQTRFADDLENIQQQTSLSDRQHDTKLQQTLILSQKRVFSQLKEFKLLEYSYNSCKLFFQS